MANKQQVIDLHQKYPAFTSKQIASLILGKRANNDRALTATDGWVRATAQRNGIQARKGAAQTPCAACRWSYRAWPRL